MSETPRDIYLRACESIAGAFEADGYGFAKSGPHFTRKTKHFIYRISFQSNRNNVAGQLVALWIHANVLSPTLKRWRVENRSIRGPYDFVAGGQIGNLVKPPKWMNWDAADPATRLQQIQSAVAMIRTIALPYFALFHDPAHVIEVLRAGEIVSMDLMDTFDFVACFGTILDARAVAARFLARRPQLLTDYRTRLIELRKSGVPDTIPSGWVEQLAALSIRFELGDLGEAAAVNIEPSS